MMDNNENPPEMQIEIDEEIAEGIYTNVVRVGHSPGEFVLDFIRIIPGIGTAKVKSRIILSPNNAKEFLLILRDNISQFEDENGQIKTEQNILFPPPIGTIGEA